MCFSVLKLHGMGGSHNHHIMAKKEKKKSPTPARNLTHTLITELSRKK